MESIIRKQTDTIKKQARIIAELAEEVEKAMYMYQISKDVIEAWKTRFNRVMGTETIPVDNIDNILTYSNLTVR